MSAVTATPRTAEARTFIVLAVAAGVTAWDLGFDLGAFDNVDHRRFWAIWILCTIALVAAMTFRDFDLPDRWLVVLAVPTLWLIVDVLLVEDDALITGALALVSLATLPFALYLLVKMLAGDFFALSGRSQGVLVALVLGIFLVGLYVGSGHERFLTCEDFERAGDFVPEDCAT